MMTRRSFAAVAGTLAAGLFARIRFAPSAPRKRLRRADNVKRIPWGDFTFILCGADQLGCEFQEKPMPLHWSIGDGWHRFGFRSDRGEMVEIETCVAKDGTIVVGMVAAQALRDEVFEVTTGPIDLGDPVRIGYRHSERIGFAGFERVLTNRLG